MLTDEFKSTCSITAAGEVDSIFTADVATTTTTIDVSAIGMFI